MSQQLIEQFIPPIQSDGLNTNTNTTLGGTLAVTGATTLTGAATLSSTLAVTGASTFTGLATFSTAPTFSGGRTATVVNESTNATLTQAQSGSTVVFTSGTGAHLTLPTPVVGTFYDFLVTTGPASGTHAVITSSGSVFISGNLVVSPTSGTVGTFVGNPAASVSVVMNGTTTGGSTGSYFRATCVSSTAWIVAGGLVGSGALATPFV